MDFDEPLRATVAMALGQERMGRRVRCLTDEFGWTYFVKSACGLVKIGRSSSVYYRLRDLQAASPQKLEVVAVAPNGNLEREYHRRFAAHRLHGEWFEPHEDILAEIDRLTSGTRI